MKKLMRSPTFCALLGMLSVIAAIVLAPIWDFWKKCPWRTWGLQIINILIAVAIICYLVFYLAKKVKGQAKKPIKILTIVEFAVLSLIALGCIFSQFKIFNVSGACQIFGLALWTRGTVEIFRAYYYRADSKEVYPVWYLAISIALVSLGVYCFAKPFIENIAILWIFVAALFIFGVLLIVYSINEKNKRITKN